MDLGPKTMVGTLLAAVQGAVLSGVLTEGRMGAWGWRIPFLIGALLGVYALYLRRNLDETPAYEREKAAEEGGHERPSLLRGVCLGAPRLRVARHGAHGRPHGPLLRVGRGGAGLR